MRFLSEKALLVRVCLYMCLHKFRYDTGNNMESSLSGIYLHKIKSFMRSIVS